MEAAISSLSLRVSGFGLRKELSATGKLLFRAEVHGV